MRAKAFRSVIALTTTRIALVALLAMVLTGVVPASAFTTQEVDQAIQKGKDFLYGEQKKGNWESGNTDARQITAYTAMAVYALLAAGEKPDDPRLAPAIKYLENQPSDATYALGMRCQLWASLPQPLSKEAAAAMQRDANMLLKGAHPDFKHAEIPSLFFSYQETAGAGYDHSNSQYGVLGMWACNECGFEVPLKFWQAVDSGWRAHQLKNGGWCYVRFGNDAIIPRPGSNYDISSPVFPRATMTVAGIATLFVTDDYLHGMEGVNCTGNIVDRNIEAALAWLSDNYDQVYKRLPFYALYGVERVGVASGRKYFGAIDWYKSGAEYLLSQQNPNGSFGPLPDAHKEDPAASTAPAPIAPKPNAGANAPLPNAPKEDPLHSLGSLPDTVFSMIFLTRGRAPLVMNKLQYEINMHGDTPREANWNQRPRDAANVTKWIGRQLEHFLNWQVVSLKVPVEELHDAPILYISGNQKVDFTDEEIAKLRTFVLEGGLIYANADCDSRDFNVSFQKVCRKLFPDYELRSLPLDSPIYTNQQFPRAKMKTPPQLDGLSNGARELVIMCSNGDPARYWQTRTMGGHEAVYEVFDDIFLYTVERGKSKEATLLAKGDTYIVKANPATHPSKTLKVARLQYAGNWDPEPCSWTRLAAIMHNTTDIELSVTPIKLGDGKLDSKSFPVAHLTGPFKFSLPAAGRDEIKQYVEGGGTLIVDACGGSTPFAQSAENELAAIFPDSKLSPDPLSLDDPVYAAGPQLSVVEYRDFAQKITGHLHTPRIRALQIKGRPAIFFSAEDLSCGLVGMPTDGIYGYAPASAVVLMEKLLLFAAR
jgi:hypothetical protein